MELSPDYCLLSRGLGFPLIGWLLHMPFDRHQYRLAIIALNYSIPDIFLECIAVVGALRPSSHFQIFQQGVRHSGDFNQEHMSLCVASRAQFFDESDEP